MPGLHESYGPHGSRRGHRDGSFQRRQPPSGREEAPRRTPADAYQEVRTGRSGAGGPRSAVAPGPMDADDKMAALERLGALKAQGS